MGNSLDKTRGEVVRLLNEDIDELKLQLIEAKADLETGKQSWVFPFTIVLVTFCITLLAKLVEKNYDFQIVIVSYGFLTSFAFLIMGIRVLRKFNRAALLVEILTHCIEKKTSENEPPAT